MVPVDVLLPLHQIVVAYLFRAMTFAPRWSSISRVTVITDTFLFRPGLPIGTRLPNVERVPLGREMQTSNIHSLSLTVSK